MLPFFVTNKRFLSLRDLRF